MKYIKIFESDTFDKWALISKYSFFTSKESIFDYFQDYIDDGFKLDVKMALILDDDIGAPIDTYEQLKNTTTLCTHYKLMLFYKIKNYNNRDIFSESIDSQVSENTFNEYVYAINSLKNIADKISLDFKLYKIGLDESPARAGVAIRIIIGEEFNL